MKIAIIGLGLIGGSIGLKFKTHPDRIGTQDKVIGIPRREETIKQALEMGVIDEGTTSLAKGVSDADVVFICTPINLIVAVISEIAPHLKKGAMVTDVGSTKAEIVKQTEKIIPKDAFFVGGHPMAGKETTKLESAEADLFVGKTWILTKTPKTDPKALAEVSGLVSQLGAKVLEMDPKVHDEVVAAISHMPLAVAASLVNAVAGQNEKDLMARCAASGFRDITRIASGDPVLGVDMFSTNRAAVLKMLAAFKKSLAALEAAVKEGKKEKIRQLLEKAKTFRDRISF